MNWLREPDAEPLPGYRLIRPLGTGGFGEVWLCEAPGQIQKAIKFVYGNLHAEDGGNIRAEQEFRALQKVKEVRHPFVVSIERIDKIDGEVVIVMELAEKSLHDCLVENQEQGRAGIPRDLLISYLSDVADGLDYLIERHNLLHLDVKPRNLFLVGNHVKVADFGLVKNLERQSSSGLMGGMSPMYAAPETFTSQISKQSDQYSLAIVYMELLTGQRPFNARTIRQLALQHMSEEPDLRPLPERDRPIVARALAKDPAKRFPNCVSFVRALSGLGPRPDSFDNLEVSTPPPVRPPSPGELTPPTAPKIKTMPARPKPAVAVAHDEGGGTLIQTIVQSEMGILRPTVIVGVGSFGLLAMKELRRRLTDRLGDLAQSPAIRFLLLDSDPNATSEATEGAADRALRDDQVFLVRLQPVSNYRRRMLDHLSEWLPREKLYAIQRSLQTMGSRALGRLAFCDNYLRFDTRFSREIQVATHPESLSQTITQSGLPLRDNCPRVYVIASAIGGSSGMICDIGFTLRRRLEKMQFGLSPVNAFLYCGASHDPSTPKHELANIAASLTELNHFHEPSITFSAQYGGPDGPRIVTTEPPFTSVYLMQRESRGPQTGQDCAAHLASYLLQDMTTPLGGDLDVIRDKPQSPDRTPFRSFGAAGIWFPRGLMLRAAARIMCQRLLMEWQDPGPIHSCPPVDELCSKMQVTPALQANAIRARLEKTVVANHGTLQDGLTALLHEFEVEQTHAVEDPLNWAKKAVERLTGYVGASAIEDPTRSYQHSRVTRALNQTVQEIANEFASRLNEYAIRLMERPGKRIAATETTLKKMSYFASHMAEEVTEHIVGISQEVSDTWANVKAASEVVNHGSGFSLFGNRIARSLRSLIADLTAYGKAKLREQLISATARVYRNLQIGLEEKARDLAICRQRLGHLERILEPASAGSHSGSHPGLMPNVPSGPGLASTSTLGGDQVLLPFGENNIDWAAARFVMTITPEQWSHLEDVVQTLILAPLGGLHAVCQKTGDLIGQLCDPLVDQTAAFLDQILEIGDIAEGNFVASGKRADLVEMIRKCHERASPLVGCNTKDEANFLILPTSEGGRQLAEEARPYLPDAKIIHVVGQTSDILVCREQQHLSPTDLHTLASHSNEAYRELVARPATSPHARFDVLEWMPLDD
jgi:eukaryotic-like serine/threonine-protein kinase